MNGYSLKQLSSQTLAKDLTLPAFIAVCIAVTSGLQFNRLSQAEKIQKPEDYIRTQQVEDRAVSLFLNLPANSYSNLLADWTFLQFIQYFGDEPARNVTGYALSPTYFAAIVKHDPRYVGAYLYLSPATSLFAGRPDKTVALMGKGLESLTPFIPNAYYVWLYKGIDQLLFMGDGHSAKICFATAASWAEQENTTESLRIAASAHSTAKFLEANPVSKQAQINAWLMVLSNVKGNRQAEYYVFQHLQRLGMQVSVSPAGNLELKLINR